MGIDFDEFAGSGHSYLSNRHHVNEHSHRSNTGMRFISHKRSAHSQVGFYNKWDFYALALGKNEFACYSFSGAKSVNEWLVNIRGLEDGELIVYENDKLIDKIEFLKDSDYTTLSLLGTDLIQKEVKTIKIEVMCGEVAIDWIQLI